MVTTVEQVLFVDDEPEILRAFRRDLDAWGNLPGVEIILLSSGEDCLKHLEQHHSKVQVVATDLRMQGMQGTDLLQHIHTQYPEIGLLLITAYSDIEAIQEAIAASIAGFILKPWEPEQLAKQVQSTCEMVRAKKSAAQHLRELEHHVMAAAEFQQKVLHPELFPSAYLDVDVLSRPAREPYCTGDYYDVIHLSPEKTLIVIGDVSGHGIKAAFVTGMLKVLSSKNVDAIRNLGSDGHFSVSAFLKKLNRDVFGEMPSYSDIVISMSVLLLDFATSSITVANAGHLPVTILHSESCRLLFPAGSAMGFRRESEFTESSSYITTGDRVVIYTDGLIEVGGELTPVPDKTLQRIFLETHLSHEQDFCGDVLKKVRELAVENGSRPELAFRDDVTILAARIL